MRVTAGVVTRVKLALVNASVAMLDILDDLTKTRQKTFQFQLWGVNYYFTFCYLPVELSFLEGGYYMHTPPK